jgi:ABC-type transport system substrate-binding protein
VNDKYWGEVPPTKFITFRFVAEETARFIMLENGEVNLVVAMAPIYIKQVEANPKLDYMAFTLGNVSPIGFNLLDPIQADINFRKAVAHAINREEMVALAREGFGTIPNNPVVWGYMTEFRDESVAYYEYDLNKAKEYLAKTSYAGEPIEMLGSNPSAQAVCQVAVSNLAEIGINIVPRNTDTPGMNADTKWGYTDRRMHSHGQEFQAWASSIRISYYPGVLGNRTNYNNPEVIALLDKALGTFDRAEREKIYKEVQRIAAEDIPGLCIYHPEQIFGITKGLDGVQCSPSSPWHDFSGMYLVVD